jgi:hypothetical protein
MSAENTTSLTDIKEACSIQEEQGCLGCPRFPATARRHPSDGTGQLVPSLPFRLKARNSVVNCCRVLFDCDLYTLLKTQWEWVPF